MRNKYIIKCIFELMQVVVKTLLFIVLIQPFEIKAQNVTVIEQFADFESAYLHNRSDDTIYVYNFWATWCKPCVQELPFFDSLNHYEGVLPIKLVLVSLDFKSQMSSTLEPFIKLQKIRNEVVLLADGKVNNWIDKVDSTWSGAIPATLVIKGNRSLFYEKTFHSYHSVLKATLNIKL